MFKKNSAPAVEKKPVNNITERPKINIDTLIGKDTYVQGGIKFTGVLKVDGHVEGDIISTDDSATLILDEQGLIEGEVRVPHKIMINGTVKGDIYAQGKIYLHSQAEVIGDVFYNLLEMEVGAIINGRMMREDAGSDTDAVPSDLTVEEMASGALDNSGKVS